MSAVSDHDKIVAQTAERIFADLADPQTINAAQSGPARSDAWEAQLWSALTNAGLTLAWVPEEFAGSGASITEGFDVIHAAGRAASAVPLAETMLAGWLLAQGGIASPAGAMTIAPVNPAHRLTLGADGRISGRASGVPFAARAEHIAAVADTPHGCAVALIDAASCRITPSTSLAGDGSDTVIFENVAPVALSDRLPPGFDRTTAYLMGAAARSVQIAGALQTILNITVQYATERVAFEKPIAKFQAIQHSLARLAGEVAAASAASSSAADTIANDAGNPDALLLEIASAKIRCGEAAEQVAAIAHQVHGAIGFSSEHVLHRFTLRALSWRDDFGSESFWAAELGKRIAARGADELWPLLASR